MALKKFSFTHGWRSTMVAWATASTVSRLGNIWRQGNPTINISIRKLLRMAVFSPPFLTSTMRIQNSKKKGKRIIRKTKRWLKNLCCLGRLNWRWRRPEKQGIRGKPVGLRCHHLMCDSLLYCLNNYTVFGTNCYDTQIDCKYYRFQANLNATIKVFFYNFDKICIS